MPNKKSKANASKIKVSAAPELTQGANTSSSGPVEPPTTTSASYTVPALPPPNFSDDFWTKNARAKALIMSTLVPGSEAWKIAEPIELASNIMRALEEKYAPKDANGKPLRGKDLAAWDKENRGKQHSTKSGVPPPSDVPSEMYDDPTSSDFIGDFVAGRPMDKYLNMYKDKLAQVDSSIGSSHTKESPNVMFKETRNAQVASSLAHMAKTGRDEIKPHPDRPPDQSLASMPAQRPREPRRPPTPAVSQPQDEPDLPIPETFDLPDQPTSASISSRRAPRRIPKFVKHDSYLSEYQATMLAQNDLDRKKQIQVAATKVLMQKVPTRDLRLLWAVLYGGESAPWPGSFSLAIPGVTSTPWGNQNHDSDYKTSVSSWNNRAGEKG